MTGWRVTGQTAAIAGREVRAVLGTGFGVALTAGFAALSGVLLVLDLRSNQARLDQWFAALFIALGLLAALLTTRSFADEERTGQLELLLTSPVHTWQLVAAKFTGAAAVMAVVLIGTAGAPIIVGTMGSPDIGPVLTGYIGLAMVGVAFLAVGLAVSASTSSSLVSGTATAGLLLALWFGGLLGRGLRGRPRVILDDLSPASHVTGFLRGTINVADGCYFASFAVLGLVATVLVIRWRR